MNAISILAFAVGIGLAGAAGSLVSFVFSFFPAKHWEWVAMLMSVVVLGGMGSILAPSSPRSAFPLSPLSSEPGRGDLVTMTFFLALFIILLVRPQGLFGEKPELA